MGLLEENPLAGKLVDVGSLRLWVSSETANPVVQIVNGNEQDIRRLRHHIRTQDANQQATLVEYETSIPITISWASRFLWPGLVASLATASYLQFDHSAASEVVFNSRTTRNPARYSG